MLRDFLLTRSLSSPLITVANSWKSTRWETRCIIFQPWRLLKGSVIVLNPGDGSARRSGSECLHHCFCCICVRFVSAATSSSAGAEMCFSDSTHWVFFLPKVNFAMLWEKSGNFLFFPGKIFMASSACFLISASSGGSEGRRMCGLDVDLGESRGRRCKRASVLVFPAGIRLTYDCCNVLSRRLFDTESHFYCWVEFMEAPLRRQSCSYRLMAYYTTQG